MAPPTGVTPVARAIDTTGFRSRLIFADQLRQLGGIRRVRRASSLVSSLVADRRLGSSSK
jgi:hypothetical protein